MSCREKMDMDDMWIPSPDNYKIKFLSPTTFCTSVQNWEKKVQGVKDLPCVSNSSQQLTIQN